MRSRSRRLRATRRVVADFNTLPELIEHAKTVDGASHILILGTQVKLYFPLDNGRYDVGTVWQEHGYWHAPAKSARTVVTRLPAGAEPIGSHTQRVGRRAGEARRRREPTGPSITGAMQLADELSQELHGSKPKELPGGFRWSEHNEAAQFTTHSPEYSAKVVVVVSIFEDATVAVDFFSDEYLSETQRYENIAHFLYETTSDLPEMLKDIQWVWETVDGYAESWQEDGGEEVDEARKSKASRTPAAGDITDDTSIVPEAVADSVLDEVQRYLGQEIPNSRDLSNSLADDARRIYANSTHYQKKLRSKDGLDWAYSFMRHWVASRLQKEYPNLYARLPRSFANGEPLPEARATVQARRRTRSGR
jgi:hypothetical protein